MSPITNAPRGRTVRRAVLLSLFALPLFVLASRGVARAQVVNASHRESGMSADGSALGGELAPGSSEGSAARAAAGASNAKRSRKIWNPTMKRVRDRRSVVPGMWASPRTQASDDGLRRGGRKGGTVRPPCCNGGHDLETRADQIPPEMIGTNE